MMVLVTDGEQLADDDDSLANSEQLADDDTGLINVSSLQMMILVLLM